MKYCTRLADFQSVYFLRQPVYRIPVDKTSCLAWEYDANCAAFTTIALATVGKQPWVTHTTHIITQHNNNTNSHHKRELNTVAAGIPSTSICCGWTLRQSTNPVLSLFTCYNMTYVNNYYAFHSKISC